MFNKKGKDPYVTMLNQVTDLLMDIKTKPYERKALLYTKTQLEHHVNLPNIFWHFRTSLTPYAMKSELSRGVGKLYCEIVAGKIGNVGACQTGIGIGTVYGKMF